MDFKLNLDAITFAERHFLNEYQVFPVLKTHASGKLLSITVIIQ